MFVDVGKLVCIANESRGDGKLALVPVITLASLIQSISKTTKVSMLMTDMQGFDFKAVKAAGDILKERVTHMETEVWRDDVYSYQANNDLCRDWLPFMTELGYTLVKLSKYNVEEVVAECEKQLQNHPERPPINESAGLNEENALWVRNDAVAQPFPKVTAVQRFLPGFTEEQYASCVFKNDL